MEITWKLSLTHTHIHHQINKLRSFGNTMSDYEPVCVGAGLRCRGAAGLGCRGAGAGQQATFRQKANDNEGDTLINIQVIPFELCLFVVKRKLLTSRSSAAWPLKSVQTKHRHNKPRLCVCVCVHLLRAYTLTYFDSLLVWALNPLTTDTHGQSATVTLYTSQTNV